ncbi:MAG TPA: hydroxysqualene dehydroxylase HpnE [Tepidisphaeraceae bacterium]
MQQPPPKVIIIGGGLAGMSAAVALQSTGASVTLLEARTTLGGRAGSFTDPQTGEKIDNCQHVLLGCCTNLIDLYRRINALHRITWERTIHFVDERGRRFGLFGVPGLPAPLNLGPSLLGFNALSLSERTAFVRAMLAMARMDAAGRLALADTSFGDWLHQHNQPPRLVQRFYDPIIISGLNEETRKCSAAYAIQIFQDAMLANARGYVMGLPNCPLEDLYSTLPLTDLRLSTRVNQLRFTGQTVNGVELTDGTFLDADVVVLATNHHNARRWIPDELAAQDDRFHHLEKLDAVPILGAHLTFDRPILTTTHVAFMTGPLQWLFCKDREGKVVHGVISAARDWVGRPKEECLQLFEQQVRQTMPGAADAKLLRGTIVIEKRATFSPTPGIDRIRPQQAPSVTGIRNLYLAGDYTQTGWPATMEGAVRSGYLAAEAITGQRFLVEDLPSQWPARLLGLRRRSFTLPARTTSADRFAIAGSAAAP